MKIISGGQVGADIAGLRVAQRLGYETGGWMPKGFRTLSGDHPEYAEMYGILETADGGYPVRTRLNVKTATVTLRYAHNFHSYGEKATARYLRSMNKPHLDVDINYVEKILSPSPHYVSRWLAVYEPEIINIAGNANIDIEPLVEEHLEKTLQMFAQL